MEFGGKINTVLAPFLGITAILPRHVCVETCVTYKRYTTKVIHKRETRRGGFRSQLST